MKTRRRLLATLAAAGLALGCGQLPMPEVVTPPELAPLGERAPDFAVVTEGGEEVRSKDFTGRILVAMGADHGFVGEFLPWMNLLASTYGRPSEGSYALLLIVEGAAPAAMTTLKEVMPAGIVMHADPMNVFADAEGAGSTGFGFVGEGPHIAVISADGTLMTLIDGPVSKKRAARLLVAMDRAISFEAEGPAPRPPGDASPDSHP